MDILKHSAYLLLLTLCMAACRGCDDDVACDDPTDMACPNYDSCWEKDKPVSAAFEIRGVNYNETWYWLLKDTCLADVQIRFVALDSVPGTLYHWEVGSPLNSSNGISYRLDFPCQDVLNQTISIRLVVERPGDSLCLSGAAFRDTMVRTLHFTGPRNSLVFGRWRGNIVGEPGSDFTMEVGYEDYVPTTGGGECSNWKHVYVENIRNDGSCRHVDDEVGILFDRGSMVQTPGLGALDGCEPPLGYRTTWLQDVEMLLQGRDSIHISFEFHSTGIGNIHATEELVFRGRRVW